MVMEHPLGLDYKLLLNFKDQSKGFQHFNFTNFTIFFITF